MAISRSSLILGTVLTLLIGMCTSSYAQRPCQTSQMAPLPWKYSISLAAWVFNQDGSLRVKGNKIDVDLSVEDLFRNIGPLDYSAQTHLEVTNDEWTFFLDATTFRLTDIFTHDLPDPTLDVPVPANIRLTQLDLATGYKLYGDIVDDCAWYTIDGYIGARNINVNANSQLNATTNVDDSHSWLGLLVGLRANIFATESVTLRANIDAAIGNLHHSFSGAFLACYAFNRCFGLFAGVRGLDFCAKHGSGQNRFIADITYWGPELGVRLNW